MEKHGITCQKCGGPLQLKSGEGVIVCTYCGTKNVVTEIEPTIASISSPDTPTIDLKRIEGLQAQIDQLIREREELSAKLAQKRQEILSRRTKAIADLPKASLLEFGSMASMGFVILGFIWFVVANGSRDIQPSACPCASVFIILAILGFIASQVYLSDWRKKNRAYKEEHRERYQRELDQHDQEASNKLSSIDAQIVELKRSTYSAK
jgi:DNA-directed RNA polymerase subunit RPC12/RpoP